MPAKKIIEAVGSTFNVIGSSIATAVAGPIPGSTPMAVPIGKRRSAHIRLTGGPAVTNPCSSWFQMSMDRFRSEPAAAGEARQVDREQLREHPVHRSRDGEADRKVDKPGARAQIEA